MQSGILKGLKWSKIKFKIPYFVEFMIILFTFYAKLRRFKE